MTVFLDISKALDDRLNAMASLPEVAWPNKEFDPTKGTLYIRPTVIPGDIPSVTTSSSGEKDEYTGIYQIDVFAPAGEAKNEGLVMADLIATQFKRGTELTENSRVVRCMAANHLPALPDGDWYILPVQIDFNSLTAER